MKEQAKLTFTLPPGLGARIAVCRLAHGLSQGIAARRIGKSQAWLSQAERGYFEPSHKDLKKIARVFGCPLASLRGDEVKLRT